MLPNGWEHRVLRRGPWLIEAWRAKGKAHESQEDAWALDVDETFLGTPSHAVGVFDGVGGLPRAALSARTAARNLGKALAQAAHPADVLARLGEGIQTVGGGTTAVVAVLPTQDQKRHIWILSVGDGGAYSTRDGTLLRLNPQDVGGLNQLSDFLGRPGSHGHVVRHGLRHGSSLLLCTDGVDGILERDGLFRILEASMGGMATRVAEGLGRLDESGRPDDSSLILVRRGREPDASSPRAKTPREGFL